MQKPKLKFKLLLLGILTFSIFGLTKNASAGTAFYFDGSDTGSQNLGTFAEPFNTMAKVNQHPFATGDDLYFKAGTTYLVPAGQFLDVDWNGTAGDWVIIGAYYGNGLFGLDGGTRPIIDGLGKAPAYNTYLSLIHKQNTAHKDAYVEVKDLRVNNSGQTAINLFYINHGKVTNCYVYRPHYGTGIQIARSNDVIVDGNTVNGAGYLSSWYDAGIAITASGNLGSSHNCQVINNTVFNGHAEGIDILQGAKNVLVSGNTVYDNLSSEIYVDAASNVEITNNVVYTSTDSPWSYNTNGGIMVDNEYAQRLCYSNNVNIHHNYVARSGACYQIGSELSYYDHSCTVNNIKIYDNIAADCDYNFRDWGGANNWTGNNIYNNISYTSNNSTMAHSDFYSSPGITWGANIFDDAVSGNAGSEDCTVPTPLAKTSGWNNLTAGAVSAADFALSSVGSAGRTACFGGDTNPPSAPTGLAVE